MTVTAGVQSIFQNFLPLAEKGKPFTAYFSSGLIAMMVLALGAMFVIAAANLRQWHNCCTPTK
jgi:hypothetical protein